MQRKNRKSSVLAVLLAIVFALTSGIFPQTVAASGAQDFENMQKALSAHIFADGKIEETVKNELSASPASGMPYVAFLSLSNGSARASVISATGTTVRGAYDNAVLLARQRIKENNLNVKYLKADIVNFVQAIDGGKLSLAISSEKQGRFRRGISFDSKFQMAFLEAELNANQLIDHTNNKLDINKINEYLPDDRGVFDNPTSTKYLFSCRGYFTDGGKCYTLGYKQDSDYGLRARSAKTTSADAKRIISSNASYLLSTAKSDGSFIYGRNANTGDIVPEYNILRHAGTSWELIKDYAITKNERLREPIEKAAEYLAKSVVYKDSETAFVLKEDTNEIVLGGNGLAVLMLVEYEKAFKNGKYTKLCEQLGNGILYMMDQKTGQFRHIYYYGEAGKADFSLKRITPESFYNGEAAYALCTFYGLTKDEKWLNAATLAVDNFLKEGRDLHKDHWTAYTMNEITKYKPKKEYYSFAMKGLQADLPAIQKKKTAAFTDLEKLMAYFDTYERMKPSERSEIAGDIREDEFIRTIFGRADFMLNSYFYPEAAMYMKNPAQVMGAVYVREDNFRIRIDDVQHFLGGYHRFYQQYEKLAKYIVD